MPVLRTADSEPIPGYRLIAPLGRGGFGEVWRCEAPGGLHKAIKFVAAASALDSNHGNVEQERRALQHVKSIRHPFLLSVERVEVVEGDLLIVMELADRNLAEVLKARRDKGHAGIARAELLSYLREVAEVLDLMNLEHGLQHLDIKPHNLFLVGRHCKVADFGLVGSLADLFDADGNTDEGAPAKSASPARRAVGVTPLYAAPETFSGHYTLFSDQYSLALTYHELLTGGHPFHARNTRHLAMLHVGGAPDLSALPEHDRPAVARALAKEPRQRFPSCTDFVAALEAAAPPSKPHTTSFEIDLEGQPPTAVIPRDARGAGSSRESRTVPVIPNGGGEGVVPGYPLVECLGRTPLGEVWQGRGPGGTPVIVKFLPAPVTRAGEAPRLDPAQHLAALEHPALPALEVVTLTDRLALVTAPGAYHLGARARAYQQDGLPGIPRPELLEYFQQAARALDELQAQYDLRHLGLGPRQLAFQDGQVLLHDFGVVELFWLAAGQVPGSLNARYAAPELFTGGGALTSDQYSLALMFQELLLGIHPFRNLNARQMANPKVRGKPDLTLLPAADRAVVSRALDEDAERRFPSNVAFVAALAAAGEVRPLSSEMLHLPPGAPGKPTGTVPAVRRTTTTSRAEEAWRPVVAEWLQACARGIEVRGQGDLFYRLAPGAWIEHDGWARLLPGTAKLRLGGFAEQFRAQRVERGPPLFVYRLSLGGGFWDRCMGQQQGMVVSVRVRAAREACGGRCPVTVTLEPFGCGRGKAARLLEENGPGLLASLQPLLGLQSERGDQERYRLGVPVRFQVAGHHPGRPIEVRSVEINRDGLALLLPEPPAGERALVELPRWASGQPVQVPVRVLHTEPWDASLHEVEVAFA